MVASQLLAQQRDAAVQPFERQGEHARAERCEHDLRRARVAPAALRLGIEPDRVAVCVDEALEPDDAGFVVAVFDAAPHLHELVRAHRRIADEDEPPVRAVLVQDIESRDALAAPADVVPPYVIVDAVVEIEILEVAELGLGGGEQLFADLDVRVHRAADIEEQQHLHAVAAFGYEVQIEPARILRRPFDRRIEIELFRHAFAREAAQAPQRDLDVARVQLYRVVEIAERALVPDFHCAAAASAFLTDADALGVVAIGAERARSRGADPFRAALVARALLAEPGLQRFHQLVPAAERFDQGLFLVAQRAFDRLP